MKDLNDQLADEKATSSGLLFSDSVDVYLCFILYSGGQKLTAEADANRLEAEHHAQAVASLEKKQKAFDKVIDEWKKKVSTWMISSETTNFMQKRVL
ncbi:unnamed protein product [Nippostrongylus brasiliensis]|uniref:Uncharacterized protein n=1 Tax=Nippostrongylus brasiliensis TaxID=27835 RepID=A0A0N4YYC1_NIPBR|nr:unnamed protein product [Nippostrongylus brasiliensis]